MIRLTSVNFQPSSVNQKKGFLIQKVFFMKGQKGGPSEVGFNW